MWMDEIAREYDRRDPLGRIAAAAYRRAAAQIRERWATQELGDAVRAAHEAGALGRGGDLSVADLASRLRVRREYLYRVVDGEEWNHRREHEWRGSAPGGRPARRQAGPRGDDGPSDLPEA